MSAKIEPRIKRHQESDTVTKGQDTMEDTSRQTVREEDWAVVRYKSLPMQFDIATPP